VRTGVSWMDGRSDDVGRTAAGAGDGRPAAIGRLSASVPAPRSSSIRPRSGLLKVSITTFVVQAGRADGQAAASLRSARPNCFAQLNFRTGKIWSWGKYLPERCSNSVPPWLQDNYRNAVPAQNVYRNGVPVRSGTTTPLGVGLHTSLMMA